MEYHERKYPRLKNRDYSKCGYYYVTICTQNAKKTLSNVGWGLAPTTLHDVSVVLSEKGKIAEQQLFELEKRFDNVQIDRYVIMPNHIHVIIILHDRMVGASPHPTLCDVVGAYKSLVTRLCNKIDNTPGRKIFQTSFYEHIIRNEQAYREICEYIRSNPTKWYNEHQI